TGNEKWVYNDNVNHPKIKKWLNEVVGTEGEDLTRHDKWLCMMYPRLKLLHKLLSERGIIFISIDDHELANLRLIMNEIFGNNNFIEYFCWTKTSTAPSLARKSRKTVEYVVCFEKCKDNRKYIAELGDGGDAPLLNGGNPISKAIFPKESVFFKIEDGFYNAKSYGKTTLHQDINIINGYADKDIELSGEFKWSQNTINEEINNGTSFVIKSIKFSIRYIRESDVYKAPTNLFKEKYLSSTIDKINENVDTNETAKKELYNIFIKDLFPYPKPVSLIQFLLSFSTDKDSIILDSFAGSGTTGHAVLNLNKLDGGNRKFILVEMEDYAEDITAERVKRVINGYGEGNKKVEGTGGEFDYYELGERLFNEDNNLNEVVGEERIREYIYYTDTKQFLSRKRTQRDKYLLDNYINTGYYFYYEKDNLTVLSVDNLNIVTQKAEQYVIYADVCLLDKEFMLKNNIIFKKIPRDIKRF
ncbi:MAG: site-specific DNA-methyltransferase, partial [Bacilli bacterium]|nr:site-specific DNA-methyltransferase [Bacilli bacterium]